MDLAIHFCSQCSGPQPRSQGRNREDPGDEVVSFGENGNWHDSLIMTDVSYEVCLLHCTRILILSSCFMNELA